MKFSETFIKLMESTEVELPTEVTEKLELIAKHISSLIDKMRRRQTNTTEKVTTLKYIDPYTQENSSIDISVKYDISKKNKALYFKNANTIVFNAACDDFNIPDVSHIRSVLFHELTHAIDPKIKAGNLTPHIKKELEKTTPDVAGLKSKSQEEFDAGWAGIKSQLEVLARIIGPKTVLKKINTWLADADNIVERELFKYDIKKLNNIWKKNPEQLQMFKGRLHAFTEYLTKYSG